MRAKFSTSSFSPAYILILHNVREVASFEVLRSASDKDISALASRRDLSKPWTRLSHALLILARARERKLDAGKHGSASMILSSGQRGSRPGSS